MKSYKVLVISDDYDKDLRKEGFYCERLNSCLDYNMFTLKIEEEYPIGTNLHYYDFVLLDFGLVGNITMDQIKELEKVKKLFIISAMHSTYIEKDEWYKKHFLGREILSFKFDEMGVDLSNKLEVI